MTTLNRMQVWFGGYSPRILAYSSQEDVEQITKLGGVVFFAAIVAMLNWGIAGWSFSNGSNTNLRLAIATATALFGVSLVLVFDRSFIYTADTSIQGNSSFKVVLYGIFRILIVIAAGSITSQAVMPIFLKDELNSQALRMLESAEKDRTVNLNSMHNIDAKEQSLKNVTHDVEKLEKASTSIPPEIQTKLNTAAHCWSDYQTQKRTLLNSGTTLEGVIELLSEKAQVCRNIEVTAKAARDGYLKQIRVQLAQVTSKKMQSESELATSRSLVANRVETARQIESASFTSNSATVLYGMLKDDKGALVKWLIITVVLLVCETLPFILKLQAGQTNTGLRLATSRIQKRMDLEDELRQREHDFTVSSTLHDVSSQAVRMSLENPEVRRVFEESFQSIVSAFAPTEAVRAMMRDLEAKNADLDKFLQRYPRYAAVISDAWGLAVKNASEIMRGVHPSSMKA